MFSRGGEAPSRGSWWREAPLAPKFTFLQIRVNNERAITRFGRNTYFISAAPTMVKNPAGTAVRKTQSSYVSFTSSKIKLETKVTHRFHIRADDAGPRS